MVAGHSKKIKKTPIEEEKSIFDTEYMAEHIIKKYQTLSQKRMLEKDEFLQNAQCIESNLYNSFTIN